MLDIGVVSRAQEEFGHATLLYSGQLGTALFLQLKTGVWLYPQSPDAARVGEAEHDRKILHHHSRYRTCPERTFMKKLALCLSVIVGLAGCTAKATHPARPGRMTAHAYNSRFPLSHDAYNAISVASDGKIYYVLS